MTDPGWGLADPAVVVRAALAAGAEVLREGAETVEIRRPDGRWLFVRPETYRRALERPA